jgi:MFS family permease
MRALFGCGVGFITPIAPGMIADYYAGDEIKAMMGYQNASVSIGGIVTTVAAGYLCTAGWRYSFLIYLLGTLIMAYTFSVFRRGEPPSKRGGEEGTFMPNRDLSRLTIVMCGYGMLLCAFYSNVAMVVADRGIGDSALSGLIVITMNFGGLASSALYFQISRRLKGYAVAFAVGLTAVGFALLGRCSSAAAFFAGSAFIGIGFGIISSEALVVANAWSPRATTMAVSVYMSGVNLGGFLSPFIMGSVAGAIGGPRSRTILQISAVASLTAFAICVATARRKNRLVGLR